MVKLNFKNGKVSDIKDRLAFINELSFQISTNSYILIPEEEMKKAPGKIDFFYVISRMEKYPSLMDFKVFTEAKIMNKFIFITKNVIVPRNGKKAIQVHFNF